MNFVKVVREGSISELEKEINNVLKEYIKHKLVDIKYSSSPNDQGIIIHTAIIIFQRV